MAFVVPYISMIVRETNFFASLHRYACILHNAYADVMKNITHASMMCGIINQYYRCHHLPRLHHHLPLAVHLHVFLCRPTPPVFQCLPLRLFLTPVSDTLFYSCCFNVLFIIYYCKCYVLFLMAQVSFYCKVIKNKPDVGRIT